MGYGMPTLLCCGATCVRRTPSRMRHATLHAPVHPQVVGDDILVTNPTRVKRGIEGKAVNALLLKVNQIGTVTESIEAVRMSKEAGWGVMTSHRCAPCAVRACACVCMRACVRPCLCVCV